MNLYKHNDSWVLLTQEIFQLNCGEVYYTFSAKDLYGYALHVEKIEDEPKNKKREVWFSKGNFKSKRYCMTPETILFVEFLTCRGFVGVKIEDWSDKLPFKKHYSDSYYHNLFHDKPDKPFYVTSDKLNLLANSNQSSSKIIIHCRKGRYAVTIDNERALGGYFQDSIESAIKYALFRRKKERLKNEMRYM